MVLSGVILTKLSAPATATGNHIIERPRLISLFTDWEQRKIVLIQGPAGYGKTILMFQAVASTRKPYLWYQLDAYDNDPATVIQHIITGLQRHLPEFGNDLLQQIDQTGNIPNPRLVVGAIVNALANQAESGLILALDDYHVIHEPAVDHFFQELSQYFPENCQLVIASRAPVPWLSNRINSALVITTQDLRFTCEETKTLFSQDQTEISEEMLDALEQNVAGWPIFLRLFQSCSFEHFEKLFKMQKDRIGRYLLNEILDQQTEEVRRFLLDTSVLETVTPADCNLLLERDDSERILDFLSDQQLFLTPLTGAEKSYRYHQLLKEFSFQQLGDKRYDLLKKAGRIAGKAGEWERAVEYFRLAGAFEEMAGLVKQNGFTLLKQGQWLTMLKWLESIPGPKQENEPWLAFFRAMVEMIRGRLGIAESWVEKATAGFALAQDQAGELESQILKARIDGRQGLSQGCLDQLNQILSRLPADEIRKRFYLALEQSACMIKLGRLHDAEQLLVANLETAQRENNCFVQACLAENLGSVYCLMGEYPKAIRKFQWALQIAPEQSPLRNHYFQDCISGIYVDWGEPDRAFEIARQSASYKERFGLVETLPANYLYMGLACLVKGQYDDSENYLRRGMEIIQASEGDRYFLVISRNFLSWCLYARNRWSESRALLEESLRQAELHGGLLPPITHMMKATVLALTGETHEAISLLNRAVPELEAMGAQIPLCLAYKALAASFFAHGRIPEAETYGRRYLELASKVNLLEGYLSVTDELMLPILRYGLEKGVRVPYCLRILVRLGEKSVALLVELAAHPDPNVRKRVVIPLAEIESPAVKTILDGLGHDPDPEVREAALRNGGKLGLLGVHRNEPDYSFLLSIKTMGPFRLFWKEKEITHWPTVKTRDLLAYLIHRGEPVGADRIIEDLWPEWEYGKAVSNFHMTMHRLRSTLQAASRRNDLILYGNKHYQLQPGSYITDKSDFEALINAGLASLRQENSHRSSETAHDLEQSLALYRGDYLMELDYPWIIWEQDHLRQLFLETKLRLAQFYLDIREYTRAMTHLNSILTVNPLIEEIYCLLMKTQAGLGDRAAVHETYRKLAVTLHQELGIEPALKTQKLLVELTAG